MFFFLAFDMILEIGLSLNLSQVPYPPLRSLLQLEDVLGIGLDISQLISFDILIKFFNIFGTHLFKKSRIDCL